MKIWITEEKNNCQLCSQLQESDLFLAVPAWNASEQATWENSTVNGKLFCCRIQWGLIEVLLCNNGGVWLCNWNMNWSPAWELETARCPNPNITSYLSSQFFCQAMPYFMGWLLNTFVDLCFQSSPGPRFILSLLVLQFMWHLIHSHIPAPDCAFISTFCAVLWPIVV